MPEMFFPDEDELMRQAMWSQPQPPVSQPSMPPAEAMIPAVSGYNGGESIASPYLIKSLLSQMSSPLAMQSMMKARPTADAEMQKYGDQIKNIKQQAGMRDVSPEEREKIYDGLRMSAYFADRKRSLTGQPSAQYELAKQMAAQQLNPGVENLDKTTKILEQIKAIKGIESSKHDDTLKQAMIAEQIKAIQDKREMSDPNSAVSNANRPATKAYIGSFSSILDAFGNKGKGRSQVPGLLETSNQIENILKSVDGASAVQQKDLIDKVTDMVSKSTGLRNTELERMAVSINAGKLDLAKDKENKKELHLTKAQEKLNREIDDLTETLQQADMLKHSLGQVTVGPGASRVQNVLSAIGAAPDAYDRYKAKLGTFRSQYLFGMGGKALSRQELGELTPSIPGDTDPPGKQEIKLDEFKSKIERMIQRRQDEYQKVGGAPIDASEVSKKASSASDRIKKGESPSEVLKDTYNKNPGNNPSVKKAELDAYAKKYSLSPENAAASLKKKGFDVEGY